MAYTLMPGEVLAQPAVGIDITVNDIQNIDQEFISVESWKRGNA